MFARKYNQNAYAKYCDYSLSKWCTNNTNKLCGCYNGIIDPNIVSELENILGPKECWLSECTINYTDQKWLSLDQLNIKKNCIIRSCIISINSLISYGRSKIELVNNCIAGAVSYSDASTNSTSYNINILQTWGSGLNFFILLLSIFTIGYILIVELNMYPILFIRR